VTEPFSLGPAVGAVVGFFVILMLIFDVLPK